MLRFVAVACLAAVAMADTTTFKAYEKPMTMERQSFGANVNAGFGDYGNFQAGTNIGVPSTTGLFGSGNFLNNVIIGVGLITLINAVVTFASPWIDQAITKKRVADLKNKGKKDNTGRALEELAEVSNMIMAGIEAFGQQYQ